MNYSVATEAVQRSFNKDYVEMIAEDDDKNWKGICITLLVITSICLLIITAIFVFTPNTGPRFRSHRLYLNDILPDDFHSKRFGGKWISESEVVYRNNFGNLVSFNCLDKSVQTLVPNTTFLRLFAKVDTFMVSVDKKYVLLSVNKYKTSHHSFLADYKIYNVSNEQLINLVSPFGDSKLQYAEWGPYGNQLIIISKNNIYYYPSITKKLKPLTMTGSVNVFNGITDWLYGEKILKSHKALWWSSDGQKLAFVSFDDTQLDNISYPKYGTYIDPNNNHLEMINVRFPKAGRVNPHVTLMIANLNENSNFEKPKKVSPPKEMITRDHYFIAFSWIDEQNVIVIWMQREQNYSVVSLCSLQKEWVCVKHLEEKIDNYQRFVAAEMFDAPLITSDKKHYLLTLPFDDFKTGTFQQVAMISIKTQKKKFLTHGSQDVIKILSHKHDTGTVYYASNLELKPGERHIFSTSDSQSFSLQNQTCLTCNQTERKCLFNDAIFSPKADFYILHCMGPDIPWTEIKTVKENNIILKTSADKKLKEIVEKKAFSHFKVIQFPIRNNFTAQIKLFLPPALEEYNDIKLPLVIEVGLEPGRQQVTKKFDINFGLFLASNRSFVYAQVSVRRNRFHENKLLLENFNKILTIEVEDYIQVVNYLKSELNFIDPNLIAIWGWSYGGYIALLTLVDKKAKKMFCCAIAVAPITNWLFVDSFTSERYFESPWIDENYVNFKKSDLSEKAELFKGHNLFILHGTADDAVHVQHTFSFMKALNNKGIYYKTQLYPDSNHYLDNVRIHLYHSMELYLLQCFDLNEDDDIVEMQINPK